MNEKVYFTSKKTEKLLSLKQDLCSDRKDRKIDALKKIINDFMAGHDMSDLFPDVIKLLQTDNCELKKLVYLYLISYSKTHSDMAILAVNTFIRDCSDPDPLIRALAVKTMGNMRVANATHHLCDPLRKCLEDEDPYVRKTAAICVLKLFQNNEDIVYEFSFIEALIRLLDDPNSSVLTNSLSALMEIFTKRPQKLQLLKFDMPLMERLLNALNECSEWGQIAILDFLNLYKFSPTDACIVADRVTSRLSHANSAVVFSAIRLILRCLEFFERGNSKYNKILSKLSPPLITMLSYEPEIQYVALRNINLIIQKYPYLMQGDLPSFYVKYNDPLYVKLEKLNILVLLATEVNVDRVLAELKDYAAEVDVEFVKKSVRAIGYCALKVESSADRCVATLMDLIETKISYVVQESIIVARDVMRKFPTKYGNILQKIGDNLFTLDDPEARAALIWIVGEFGEWIENCRDIIEVFTRNFIEENSNVQLHILTAVVKIYLKKPQENFDLFEQIVSVIEDQIDNPDIKDRCSVYSRLIRCDLEAARKVILAQKPIFKYESQSLSEKTVNELISQVSTLYSVHHKLPKDTENLKIFSLPSTSENVPNDNDLFDASPITVAHENKAQANQSTNQTPSLFDDLIGLDFNVPNKTEVSPLSPMGLTMEASDFVKFEKPTQKLANDELFMNWPPPSDIYMPDFTEIPHERESPLSLQSKFVLLENNVTFRLRMTNHSLRPYKSLSIQLKPNYFGLAINYLSVEFPQQLLNNQKCEIEIPMAFSDPPSMTNPLDSLQMNLKTDQGDIFFYAIFPVHYYFIDPGQSVIDLNLFKEEWNVLGPMYKKRYNTEKLHSNDEILTRCKSIRMDCLLLESPKVILAKCVLRNSITALVQFVPQDKSITIGVGSKQADIIMPLINLLSNLFPRLS